MRVSTILIRSSSFIRRNSIIYPLRRRLSSTSKQPLDIFSINFDNFKDIDEAAINGIDIKQPTQNVVLFDKEFLVDEGGTAIYDTETLSIATRYFSPAVISALKNVNFTSKDKRLDEILKTTKTCLETISSTKLFPSLWPRFIFDKINSQCRSKYFPISRDILSEEDTVAFLACMSILRPSEIYFWKELDKLLADQIPLWSFSSSLFCAYCISFSTEKLRHDGIWTFLYSLNNLNNFPVSIQGQWKTPKAVFERFLKKRKEDRKLNFLVDDSRNVVKFTEIGASDVSESYAIEQLGLLLHLLTTNLKDVVDRGSIISDLSAHSFRVLLSIHSPIKFASFRMLWCNAPLLNFPEGYIFYKSLYKQILYSVNASPLHAIQQLDDVIGLLSSMVTVKFKDALLIDRLCSILHERGIMHKDKFAGIRIFSFLIQLDCFPLALPFMQKLLQGDEASLLKNSSWLLQNPLSLSTTSQNSLCKVLNERPNPNEFTGAELILLVLCNNPNEAKNTANFRRYLKKVESEVVPKITTLPLADACSILQAYALGTRLYPPMICEIDKCLSVWNVNDLTLEQVTNILRSLAKLNHINGNYIGAYIDRFWQSVERMTLSMFDSSFERIIFGLWSIAVMNKLQVGHAKLVLPHLQQCVATRGKHLPDKLVGQLQQVLLDLKLNSKIAGEEIDLSKFGVIGRRLDPNWRENDKSLSSFSHLDVSNILNEMGISHFNEYRLTDNMIADIYVPIANIPERLLGNWTMEKNAGGTLGLVIEYDGPTHFDAYSMRPLGTTVMKGRHIVGMGYLFASLPFWKYDQQLQSEKKKKILSNIIYEQFNN